MDWPSPQLVLYVLGAFVAGYGLSLVVRAARARRWKGTRTTCPDCGRPWAPKDAGGAVTCSACGAHEPVASAINAARVWIAVGLLTSIGGVVAFTLGLWVAESLAFDRGFGAPRPGIGPFVGGGIGVSLFGLYVTFLGWRGDRARGRRRCPKCWYLIDDAVGLQCSECGREARHEKELYKTRRRLRLAALGLVLIAVGQLGWMERRVRAGGWLAAVPTEVLIVGMPWLPAECLTGGLAGADEDWSLTGRFAGRWGVGGASYSMRGAWVWHRPWAVSRAGGWVLRARTSGEAIERFSVLERVGDERGVAPIALAQRRAITHAASLGIAGLSDPNDQTAGPLLQMASRNAWVPGNANNFDLASPMQTWSVMPEMRELARLHQGELLVALGDPIGVHSTGVVSMLGLGPGDQVVVNALLDTPTANRMSSRAIVILLSQNEAARDMVVESMSDANPARRRAAMEAAFRLLREDERGVVRPAIVHRLRDPDPIVAFQAAQGLWLNNPSEQEVLAIFDALATAVVADPALVPRAADLLQTEFESFGAFRRTELLAMGRSLSPGAKEFFVAVVLGNANEVDPALGARALDLIETGTPAPTNVPAWQLESLRVRFGSSEPEPAP